MTVADGKNYKSIDYPVNRDYMPGIEGIRALAVAGVLIYHADIYWLLPGGFLGVDIFFTLSGFLITYLLVGEFRAKHEISIPSFYLRRVKRLLPALYVLLVATVVVSNLWASDAVWRLRKDIPAAIFYVSNWWQIFTNQSYFEQLGRPALLQHLWSLAIEEQFYVVWPAIVVVVLRNSGRITLSVLSLTLSVIVTCWMGWLAVDRGFPENADPSRIYLGTDTHAMGLLLGASLGALLNSTVSCSRPGVFVGGAKFNSSFLDALGLMCFGILCTLMQVVNESNQFLYLGGFLLTSTASILLILSVADGRTKCGRVLSRQPFRWVGQRSYGLYLWHWPVYALLRPKYELIDDPAISLAIRLGLTAFIAECSYRFVEDPIRSGRCVNWGRSTKLAFMVTAFISTLSAATFFFQSSTLPAVPTEIADAINGTEASIASKQFVENGGKLAEDVAIQKMQSLPASSDGRLLTVIGDSVMLGMRDYFTRNFEGVGVDAEVGRQGSQGLKRVLELKANGQLAPNVIVHLGTNGYLTETHIRSLLNELADRRSVLLVNVHASRRWTVSNNEMLERVYPDFQNVRLLNWHRLSSDHTEYFVSDGIHLSAVGIQAMAKLITDSIDMPRSKSGVRSVVQVNRPITSLKVGAETGGIAIEVVPAITSSVSTSQASQSDPEIKPSTVDGSILSKDLIIRQTYERLVAKRELEMQYAGDDEIVRCRMGIPISRRLRDQRNFQTWNRYLIEANGDERKAFAMFYEFDCKNR